MSYTYSLVTLADVKTTDQVFVPNTDVDTALELWRYLTGLRQDFPEYNDGDIRVVEIGDDAWCVPKIYRETYCPLTMACIIRKIT